MVCNVIKGIGGRLYDSIVLARCNMKIFLEDFFHFSIFFHFCPQN